MAMDDLLRLSGAARRDPRIAAWFDLTDPLRSMTRPWFERMRGCGADVRELLHDGCPVACVGDAPFAYVNAFRAHASVGFFHGAMLADSAGLLEGEGKRMRHVKLRLGQAVDEKALGALIAAAYADIRQRLGQPAAAKKQRPGEASASQLIDARIKALGDWRGEVLGRVRAIIKAADPDVVEAAKWRKPSNAMLGVPVWEHAGIICTGETYKAAVKLTFAKGAALADPSGLFNASLEGNVRRAIDIHEGDRIDAKALKALVRAAVALNTSERGAARSPRARKPAKRG
jgi:hypothetical protein